MNKIEMMSTSDLIEDIRTRGVAAVVSAVENIGELVDSDYDYSAHGAEDILYAAVLYVVSAGHPDSVTMAKTVLKTQELDFPRYTM